MSSNLPLVCLSHRVLPFLLCITGIKFSMYGIPPQQIFANSKLIIEGGIILSEYSKTASSAGIFTIW